MSTRTWTSVTSPKTRQKPREPLKTTGYNHHTNHSARSPFLHIQLQIKTTLKRRIQLQNRISKVHQTNTHNLTTYHNYAIHTLSHWNVKAPSKSQNPQNNQKIISTSSHVTFTYPPTLQQPPPQKQMPSFTFPTIIPRTAVELLGIIPQNSREITICTLHSKDPAL